MSHISTLPHCYLEIRVSDRSNAHENTARRGNVGWLPGVRDHPSTSRGTSSKSPFCGRVFLVLLAIGIEILMPWLKFRSARQLLLPATSWESSLHLNTFRCDLPLADRREHRESVPPSAANALIWCADSLDCENMVSKGNKDILSHGNNTYFIDDFLTSCIFLRFCGNKISFNAYIKFSLSRNSH